MDDAGLQIPSTTPPSTGNDSLREQVESLKHLVVSLLVLAVVIAGTFDLFLWRQVRYLHSDLQSVRPQAEAMMADYQKNRAPAMDQFLRQIVAYGQTNKDFAPILAKYSLTKPASATPSPPPPGAVPSAPSPKK